MKKQVFTGCGNTHFITFGCSGKRKLLNTPRSRQIVISVLANLVDKGQVKVSGFVVMPDHVHALFWYDQGDSDHSKGMQTWKRLSSHYLIKYYQETSPEILSHLKRSRNGREIVVVWKRRFYDFNLNSHAKASEKLAYIHENPVRKGIVSSAEQYSWSSARWYSNGRSVGVKIDPGF